jgi:hypothetical protein
MVIYQLLVSGLVVTCGKNATKKMSCGNSKQQIERAGVNALQFCQAPYRNAAGDIVRCGCAYSEHRDEGKYDC